MRYSITLLIGVIFGVAILWGVQASLSAFCQIPLVGQFVCKTPPVVDPPGPPPPTATPIPPTISWKDAKMVNKAIYSEKEYSAQFTGKWDYLVVGGRVILSKEVTAVTSGSCSAGIDFEAKPPTAEVNGTRVSMRITEPDIFGCEIRSLTYIEGSGLLPAPSDLYNQLSARAIGEVRTRAEQSDLVAKARDSATMQIELYLRRLGFQQVSIDITSKR
jgi:hypothetical protein